MQRPMCANDLLRCGPLRRLGKQVLALETVDSTNALLRRQAGDLPDGTVAIAEHQTAGRGRLGRAWVEPEGSSILLSVLLFEALDSDVRRLATTSACVAACEAIEECTDQRPRVRWPNDLVIGSRKLGGVLAESASIAGRFATERALIVGIGINCLQQPGHFEGELAGKATSLAIESGRAIDRALIAGELVRRLDEWIERLAQESAAVALMQAWKAKCDDVGARVTVSEDGSEFHGAIVELTDDGGLILDLGQSGRRRFGAATTTRIW